MKDLALEVSTDVDQKFELALSLDDLEQAISIAESSTTGKQGGGNELKWRALGDRALQSWKIDLASKCFSNAGDLPALLLVYSSIGDKQGLKDLAEKALQKGLNNIAFAALLQCQDTNACVDLLIKTDRIPEAALFARSYAPR
jgi:coatomer subunit beta'